MKWFFGLYPGDKVKIKGSYYYISDFFPEINILFNIYYILKKNKLYKEIENYSFDKIFSIKNNKVMADSGSFIYYRKNIKPPRIDTLIRRYRLINPDYAVHNDIPISFLKKNIKSSTLLKKNLTNAKEFLMRSKNENYIPIGVAQGFNKHTYLKQIKELYYLGFEVIGIGGIAKKSNSLIKEYLEFVKDFVKKNKIKIHIFGVGRFDPLKNIPIYSFDNTSPVQDAHRDSIGKVSYYYWITNKKSIKKLSLFDINNGLIEFNEKCCCEMCEIFQDEIFQTGKAPRNRARSYHNAYIYQKCLDLNVSQHNI